MGAKLKHEPPLSNLINSLQQLFSRPATFGKLDSHSRGSTNKGIVATLTPAKEVKLLGLSLLDKRWRFIPTYRLTQVIAFPNQDDLP